MPPETTEDLLTSEDDYVRAEPGKRFTNYVIDTIVFYVLFFTGAFIWGMFFPLSADSYTYDSGGFQLFDRLISLVLYATYMGIMESVFKGRSVGKFITRTRAVNLDGSPISTNTAFLRGFARAVPFCVFSALGSPCIPWQDKWTDTMVVVENKKQYS